MLNVLNEWLKYVVCFFLYIDNAYYLNAWSLLEMWMPSFILSAWVFCILEFLELLDIKWGLDIYKNIAITKACLTEWELLMKLIVYKACLRVTFNIKKIIRFINYSKMIFKILKVINFNSKKNSAFISLR